MKKEVSDWQWEILDVTENSSQTPPTYHDDKSTSTHGVIGHSTKSTQTNWEKNLMQAKVRKIDNRIYAY